MTATDESWADVARSARDACAAVGYPITPKCLPDEPEACGHSFSQHAMSYFVILQVVAAHQLKHLDPAPVDVRRIRQGVTKEIEEGCQLDHPAPSQHMMPCPRPGCEVRIPRKRVACRDDWYALPSAIRDRINGAYVPGQTLETATPEYLGAYETALGWYRRNPRHERG